MCSLFHCHACGCFNPGLHIVAPERGEGSTDEEGTSAKWLELVGPADHSSGAVWGEGPLFAYPMNEPAQRIGKASQLVCETVAGGVLRQSLGCRRPVR